MTFKNKNNYKIPSDKDLEKACQNSYSNKQEDKKLNGTNYFDSYHFNSGLDADVYYNDKCLVIVFRGTDKNSLSDMKADIVMWRNKNMPQQFYEADRLWNKMQDLFPNREVIATGHSLGGSISVYLGNKYGDRTVAFSPFGIGDIVEPRENADNITNYGNPRDPVFMDNANNQIGKVEYVFNQNNFVDKYSYDKDNNYAEKLFDINNRFHKIEHYGDIEYATEDISGEEYINKMKKAYEEGKISKSTENIYRQIENYATSPNTCCSGYVNVRSYSRNGEEVKGYTRNCPYHN